MKRGDFVTIALQGDYGKPRPALVVQADQFHAHDSVTVLLLSSSRIDAPLLRIDIEPSSQNGLTLSSQIMIDKAMTLRTDKIGKLIGQIEAETMLEVERCFAIFVGIAK